MKIRTFILLLLLSGAVQAQMRLNFPFGDNGIVKLSIDDFNEPVSIIKLSNDTLLLLANLTKDDSVVNTDFALIKLTPDGHTVSGFGNNGCARYDFNGMDASNAVSFVQLSDGSLMVLGAVYNSTTAFNPACMMHLFADGGVDSGFGTMGTLYLHFAGLEEFPKVIKTDRTGKILIGGFSTDSVHLHSDVPVIARMNTNGKLDSTFGINGKAYLRFPNGIIDASRHVVGGVLYDLLPLPDGSLLACGGYSDGNSLASYITKLNTDGSVDSAFFNAGYIAYNFTPFANNQFVKMNLSPDGKVWFGATSNTMQGRDFYIGNLNLTTSDFNITQADFNGQEDVFADIQFYNGSPVFIGRAIAPQHNQTWYQGDYFALTAGGLFNRKDFTFSEDTSLQCGAVSSVMQYNGNLVCYGFKHKPNGQSELMLLGVDMDALTSVNKITTEPFNVYPNPASSTLNIVSSNYTGIYSLTDLSGRVIKQFDVQEENTVLAIDVSAIPPGLYILGNGEDRVKVVVE